MSKRDSEILAVPCAEARAALAEAIGAVAAVDREIAGASAALGVARDRRREARRNLERLTSSPDTDAGPDVGAFVQSVRVGEALDVAALAPPRLKEGEVAALETAVARWGEMLKGCEASLEELNARRERVAWRRDDAVNEVVRRSSVAQTLLEGLAAAQQAVFARRLVLSRLVAHHLVDDAEEAEIRSVLRGLQAPLPEPDFMLAGWRDRGTGARWQAGLDTLATDCAAALPTVSELLAAWP